MPVNQKPRVLGARSHVGVQVGAAVFNSILLGKNGITALDLLPWGLQISAPPKSYIVPFANIQSIEVEEDGQGFSPPRTDKPKK